MSADRVPNAAFEASWWSEKKCSDLVSAWNPLCPGASWSLGQFAAPDPET